MEGIEVFSDELNHASMIQGIKNANVPCHFRNDVNHLRELLMLQMQVFLKSSFWNTLFYGKFGSPLKQIVSLAKEFNCLTYLDEVTRLVFMALKEEELPMNLIFLMK